MSASVHATVQCDACCQQRASPKHRTPRRAPTTCGCPPVQEPLRWGYEHHTAADAKAGLPDWSASQAPFRALGACAGNVVRTLPNNCVSLRMAFWFVYSDSAADLIRAEQPITRPKSERLEITDRDHPSMLLHMRGKAACASQDQPTRPPLVTPGGPAAAMGRAWWPTPERRRRALAAQEGGLTTRARPSGPSAARPLAA